MPDGLTDAEVWLWEQTVPELERLNLLTPAHFGVLRGCLMMWEQAHLAHRASEKFGALVPVKTKAGTALQSNPAMRETRLAVAEMRACARELGCTPRRPPTDDRH
jgi:phage terminase small subunit